MDELILICEDNPDIQALLEYNLRQEEFLTYTIARGDEIIDAVERFKPNLVLLDLMLPGMNGMDVCRQIRAKDETRRTAVIIVTAKASEKDRLEGLEAGADDYVTKPFSPRELVARVKAVLRRASGSLVPDNVTFEAGPIMLNPASRRVFCGDNEIFLTSTEYKLLKELLTHKGRVVTREALGEAAASPGELIAPRTIDVHMVSLRRKLGDAAELIKSIRGVGYRLGDS